ncbi:HAD-IA family hydrolase [Nocardioides sp. HDW12B]|uniref:HAD-IA family hydrolase n=1 Tax=Nocardioides sp. HDW12B TaxID=2714939 RepID=UPI00140DAFD4|nr:HAD-IA family hydrolase [Nocardioides sp. HDW12B]QIK68205.1 HAD-IA family hydrolase [Nocardioides sp. HDW12B]
MTPTSTAARDETPAEVELDAAALVFDNDGVLVDSVEAGNEAWTRWAEEHDQDPAHVLTVIHGRRAADTVADLLATEAPDRVAAASARIDELELETAHRARALPGAHALLTALAALADSDGLRWAVATSGGRPLARARIEAAGLPVPAVLVTAEDVEAGKPAPDPYVTAAARLGVDPAECVVFEDTEAGIEAGRAAGATVVGVNLMAGPGAAAHVVTDLASVSCHAQDGRVVVRLAT